MITIIEQSRITIELSLKISKQFKCEESFVMKGIDEFELLLKSLTKEELKIINEYVLNETFKRLSNP